MSESDNGRQAAESQSREQLLNDYCSSDLLSGEGLRYLFDRHALTPNNNKGSSNYDGSFSRACRNDSVTEAIIRCLIEYFPRAARSIDENGTTPLHVACGNKSMTRGIVQLIIDSAPDSVHSVDIHGSMPLHCLCRNKSIDETALGEIKQLLLEKHPKAVRHADDEGSLPVHIAANTAKSPDFCRALIDAYPGSERISDAFGSLPLHYACCGGTVATVECLRKLYPYAINHATADGFYPIHYAIIGLSKRANPECAIETVQYLLYCDSKVKFQKLRGMISLLHYACRGNYNDSNIDAALEIVKTIYDAHPEAIEDEGIARNIRRCHQQVQAFINSEMVYARQAKNRSLMNTPDDIGQLPLYTALQNNVRLGSIKLLVKGNPSAIRSFDDNGAIPLHVVCQHHDSASVVGYIISLANITTYTIDREGNTALHYACRGAKYETISLLLDKYDAVSVSKRNAHKELPIDLLWESNAVEDRVSVGYTGCVFRLLKAYPETAMNVCTEVQYTFNDGPNINHSGNGKKRKLGSEYLVAGNVTDLSLFAKCNFASKSSKYFHNSSVHFIHLVRV